MPIDLENPQMLQCIICRFQQVIGNILNQPSSIVKKRLIKYLNTNGITPMKRYIESTNLHLVANFFLQLIKNSMVKLSNQIGHSRQ